MVPKPPRQMEEAGESNGPGEPKLPVRRTTTVNARLAFYAQPSSSCNWSRSHPCCPHGELCRSQPIHGLATGRNRRTCCTLYTKQELLRRSLHRIHVPSPRSSHDAPRFPRYATCSHFQFLFVATNARKHHGVAYVLARSLRLSPPDERIPRHAQVKHRCASTQSQRTFSFAGTWIINASIPHHVQRLANKILIRNYPVLLY